MKKIIIRGRRRLSGDILVGGSKNAALPILFATLLTDGVSEITDIPDIGDVFVAKEILSALGAKITVSGKTTYVDTRNLSYAVPPDGLVTKIRASTYLIGSCLSRFGECRIANFGGCNFSSRPIDMHLDACRALGARVYQDRVVADRLSCGRIDFKQPSVGATVNAILLAAAADGETHVTGYAKEPHIDALIDFLVSAGACIEKTPDALRIFGRRLHGGKVHVIGDVIEAGTYLAAGLITGGDVRILNFPSDGRGAIFDAFSSLGAGVVTDGESVSLIRPDEPSFFKIKATPYPGFPTDLQPIMAPLMAHFSGGEILDTVWRTRFGYLAELGRFGVRSRLGDSSAAISPSHITPANAAAVDLRGGMACVLAALTADGESSISPADTVLRGYGELTEKLCALGAEIKIKEVP